MLCAKPGMDSWVNLSYSRVVVGKTKFFPNLISYSCGLQIPFLMKKYVDPSERDCAKSEECAVHAWKLRSPVSFLAV